MTSETWSKQLEIEEKIRKIEEILEEDDLEEKNKLRIAFENEFFEDLEIGYDYDLEEWNNQLENNIVKLQNEWEKLNNQYNDEDTI